MSEQAPFVVTISRQLGSGGSCIGQRIAARLGIQYADREIVRKAAEMLNVSEKAVEPMDEKMTPLWLSVLRSFESGRLDLCYIPPVNLPPHDEEFHETESKVITQISETCSAVIVGRGGYHILRNHPGHFAVFLHADDDFRINRIQDIYKLSARDAAKLVIDSDRERRQYIHSIVGGDWTDARQYHLSIDTGAVGFDKSEEMIIDGLFARLKNSSSQ